MHAKELQVGMSVKRVYWPVYRTIVQIEKQDNVIHFSDGWKAAYAGIFELQEEPKVAKIGDAITVVPHPDGNYFVASVAENGHTVKLQHANGMIAHGIYNLKEFPKWSINGVPCQEFFGNAAQETAPPPVDVPQRKKRIYNAISS